jgi:hypothetical protein
VHLSVSAAYGSAGTRRLSVRYRIGNSFRISSYSRNNPQVVCNEQIRERAGGGVLGSASALLLRTIYQLAIALLISYITQFSAFSAHPPQSAASKLPTSLGWHAIPNTKLSEVCAQEPALRAAEGCAAVIADWNGGVADTSRNRLIFWGGGHAGYAGNEVYALDLVQLSMTRLTNPSLPPTKCVATLTNPVGPNSRHTYNGLAYIEDADEMFVFGGAAYRGNDNCQPSPDPQFVAYGGRLSDTWTLDLKSLQWQRRDPVTGKIRPATIYPNLGEGVVADYDPTTKKVYVGDTASWYSYDPKRNAYTELNRRALFSYLMTGAIDPERRLLIIFGGGQARAFDLKRNILLNWDRETKGCEAIQNSSYPGIAYDSTQKAIVGWAGGDTAYRFDPTSKECRAVTFPGGPGNQQGNGTLGRFRYFPALGVFGLVNDWKQDAYILRLRPRD